MEGSLHKQPGFEGMNRNRWKNSAEVRSFANRCRSSDANASHAADATAADACLADTLCFSTFQADREKLCIGIVSLKMQKIRTKVGTSDFLYCILTYLMVKLLNC